MTEWPRDSWVNDVWDSDLRTACKLAALRYAYRARSGSVAWVAPDELERTASLKRTARKAAVQELIATGWLTEVEPPRGQRTGRYALTRPPGHSSRGSDSDPLTQPSGSDSDPLGSARGSESGARGSESDARGSESDARGSESDPENSVVVQNEAHKSRSARAGRAGTSDHDDRTYIRKMTSASPEEAGAVIERLRSRKNPPRNLGAYLRTMAKNGSLVEMVLEVRSELGRAAAASNGDLPAGISNLFTPPPPEPTRAVTDKPNRQLRAVPPPAPPPPAEPAGPSKEDIAAARRRLHALPEQRVEELLAEVRRREPDRSIPWPEARLAAAALDEQGWQAGPDSRGETA